MKNTPLTEGQFGNGGIRTLRSRFHIKLRRLIRPKVSGAGIPFDWATGVHRRQYVSAIKNQGQSDSCGGQAKAYWIELVTAMLSGQPPVAQSAKSIYAPIAYPGGGTTVPSLENDLGALDESVLPSYENGQVPSEAYMTDKSWLTAANIKLKLAKAGWQAISVNIDMESIAEAIRDYGAVIWDISGQNGGFPGWLSNNPQPPSPSNPNPLWGHFMASEGAGMWNGLQAIDMFQSWGPTVGDLGIQHFTAKYINSGYIHDVFTFVKKKPSFVFNTDLSYGMQSSDILQLQTRLGIWQTGYFGPLTFASVIIYQKWHGIPETGYVGPLTRQSLNNYN